MTPLGESPICFHFLSTAIFLIRTICYTWLPKFAACNAFVCSIRPCNMLYFAGQKCFFIFTRFNKSFAIDKLISSVLKQLVCPTGCTCVQGNSCAERPWTESSYLPGTGDTVITKAVPPGRGSPLHSGVADPCDYPKCG